MYPQTPTHVLFELKMSTGIYSPNRTKKRPPNTIVRRHAIIIFCSIHRGSITRYTLSNAWFYLHGSIQFHPSSICVPSTLIINGIIINACVYKRQGRNISVQQDTHDSRDWTSCFFSPHVCHAVWLLDFCTFVCSRYIYAHVPPRRSRV